MYMYDVWCIMYNVWCIMYMYMYMYMCMCMCMHMYVYVRVYAYMCMCVCVYMCMYKSMYMYTYMYTYMYICMYIYIYIHIFIYIYIYTTIAIQSYTDTNTHRRFKQAHKHPAGPETVLVKIEFYKKMVFCLSEATIVVTWKVGNLDVQIWVFFGQMVFSPQ